jgi:class 3 adenylate cyclase/pimeloyl-ACP methyl ester carboxylesterase
MAEGEVRYCTTPDGVRIAYAVDGAGPPLLLLPMTAESTFLDHLVPPYAAFRRALNEGRAIVRVNPRGTGLSERELPEGGLALDAAVVDLEAVCAAASLDRVSILAPYAGCMTVATFAARHPERIARLVFFAPYARPPATRSKEEFAAVVHLCRANWETASQVVSDLAGRRGYGELSLQLAELLRRSVGGELYAAGLASVVDVDVRPLLKEIAAPALVLHRDGDQAVPEDAAREFVAGLPNARFITFQDPGYSYFVGGEDKILNAINAFLDEDPQTRRVQSSSARAVEPSRAELPSGTAVILFTDIAESTALTERLGDDAFRAAARELDGRLRAAIREANGMPIEGKRLGDGLLATFASARDALAAARRCVELSAESELRLHVGVHAGDITREEGDIYGGAVNIAARICDLCEPGAVLVSQTVRDLARTSAGVAFDDRGEQQLKGIADAVRLYEVRWRE